MLQLPVAALGPLRQEVATLVEDLRPFLARGVPALTLRIGHGASLSDNPADGRTFGEHRCRLRGAGGARQHARAPPRAGLARHRGARRRRRRPGTALPRAQHLVGPPLARRLTPGPLAPPTLGRVQPTPTTSRRRVRLPGWRLSLVLVAAWLVVALPAAAVLFLTGSRETVVAGHDAEVQPTLDGYATVDLGPYLPNFRYPRAAAGAARTSTSAKTTSDGSPGSYSTTRLALGQAARGPDRRGPREP